jgi:divalent metal cation (Fe/Co/Zn/Cd) transporter
VTAVVERREALHRRALLLEYSTVGWNVVEAVVAIAAGVLAGSVALIGFGADSAIEVVSAVGLLWRLRKAGPHAPIAEESAAEKRALYVVAITFFLLAAYISYEGLSGLLRHQEPVTSPVGIVLSVLSLVVMPILAYAKHAPASRWAAGHWLQTPKRPGCAPTCHWRCSSALDPMHCSAGGGPIRSARWSCCQ